MACNKNEWHPVHWINYWISKIAKIPSTEQDGGINVMSINISLFLSSSHLDPVVVSRSISSHRHNVNSAILFGGGNFRDFRNPMM
jgi:hypothetical protein